MSAEAKEYWNEQAATFDDEADHGLHDPRVRSAWTELLGEWLPATRTRILDIGCGTASLSLLLAELGHAVTGIDFAPAMIEQARAKAQAAGQPIPFHVMDATTPDFAPGQFDLLLCRHLLWALPEPTQVLQRWVTLLAPAGRLLLIEGYWHTGGGLHAQQILAMLPPMVSIVVVENLSDRPGLWGGTVTDERYLIVADYTDDGRLGRSVKDSYGG